MDRATLRDDMVDGLEYEAKGHVRSADVSVAMRTVPRHEFVDDQRSAYADRELESYGSRVLSPSTVARLAEALALDGDESVLIVGVGVGYTAAVVAELVGAENVHAVDIDRRLVWEARTNLGRAGYDAVLVDCRDGANGLSEYAPFDRVLLEAASLDPPRRLLDQLAADGRLVLPLGGAKQTLAAVDADGDVVDRYGPVRFEPLLVEGEQPSTVERNRTVREEREFAQRAAERRRGWEQDWIDWENR